MRTNIIIGRIFFIIAVACGSLYYLNISDQGYFTRQKALEEYNSSQRSLHSLEKEVADLKKELLTIQTSPFQQERIMREDLQMSYTNEYVYLLLPHRAD